MRLRHPSGRTVHIGCEVTPEPTRKLPTLITQLDTYAAARIIIGADSLGVNLWLPPALAAAVAGGLRARTRLRAELDARRLEVVTLSGLSFDEGEASAAVEGGSENHEPGWDEPARLDYTLDLARILIDLMPDESVRGTVGTIGLGRRAGHDEATEKASAGILRRLSAGLADLAWQNGRAVRVGFHTTDGYAVDGANDTVAALTRVDKDRLGVRLDLDHVSRTWPDPAAGIDMLSDAGLSITEVRLTAAPGPDPGRRRAALARLLGPDGPQTEYVTLAAHVPDPSAKQVAAGVTYVLEELATLGLAPENEPCPA